MSPNRDAYFSRIRVQEDNTPEQSIRIWLDHAYTLDSQLDLETKDGKLRFKAIVVKKLLQQIDRDGDLQGEIELSSEDMKLDPSKGEKVCAWQKGPSTTLICTIFHAEDDLEGTTTLAACRNCNLPDTEIICSHVAHPSIWGNFKTRERSVADVRCSIGKEMGANNVHLCIPGGRDCWTLQHKTKAEPVMVVSGAPSLATEIDNLNAILRTKHNHAPLHIVNAKIITDLTTPCHGEENFKQKVQAINTFIDSWEFSALLRDEQKQQLKDQSKTGSINELEQFLEDKHPDYKRQIVTDLRNIKRLSWDYPRHPTSSDTVKAAKNLGLGYPIENYSKAWDTVITTFQQNLELLRLTTS